MAEAPVRETQAMIAGMAPLLTEGDFVFCCEADPARAAQAAPLAAATVAEDEGLTLVLPLAEAARLGYPADLPMARITLRVHSALDGVGLTAAVARALAARGIACNVIAGFHHDHLFVPLPRAGEAMAALTALQAAAASG
jgi:hypothetical protein